MRLLLLAAVALYGVYAQPAQIPDVGVITGMWVNECYGYEETVSTSNKYTGETIDGTDVHDGTTPATGDRDKEILYLDAAAAAGATQVGTGATGGTPVAVRKCRFTLELNASNVAGTTHPVKADGTNYACFVPALNVARELGGRGTDHATTIAFSTLHSDYWLVEPSSNSGDANAVIDKDRSISNNDSNQLFSYNARIQASDKSWASTVGYNPGSAFTDAVDTICGVIDYVSSEDAKAGAVNASFSIPLGAYGVMWATTTNKLPNRAFIPLYQSATRIFTPAAAASPSGTIMSVYFKDFSQVAANFDADTGASKEDELADINVWGLKYTPMTNYDTGFPSQNYGFISFKLDVATGQTFTYANEPDVWVATGAVWDASAGALVSSASQEDFLADFIWTKVPRASIGKYDSTGPTTTFTNVDLAAGETAVFRGIATKVDPTAATSKLHIIVCAGWGGHSTATDPSTGQHQGCVAVKTYDDTGFDSSIAGTWQGTQSIGAYTVNFGSSTIKLNGAPTGGLRIQPDSTATGDYYAYDITNWEGPQNGVTPVTNEVPGYAQVQSKFVRNAIATKPQVEWGKVYSSSAEVYAVSTTGTTSSQVIDDEDFSVWQPLTSFWSSGSINFSESAPTLTGHMNTYTLYKRNWLTATPGDMTVLDVAGYSGTINGGVVLIEQFAGATSGSAISKLALFAQAGDTSGWGSQSTNTLTQTVSGTAGWGAETNDKIALVLSGAADTFSWYNSNDMIYFVDKRYTSSDVQGTCKKIEVCGSSISYIQGLTVNFGGATSLGSDPLDDGNDNSKEILSTITLGSGLRAGQYDVYYEQRNTDEMGGFKYPAKQASVSVTIQAPTAIAADFVTGTALEDQTTTVAKPYTYDLWNGARFTGATQGIVKFEVSSAPASTDLVALVPSGGGWSPTDDASDSTSLRAQVETTDGCIQQTGSTSTSFSQSFYKCFNFFGPATYTVWYKQNLANAPWSSQQATFTLTLENSTGKQWVAKVRESATISGTGTGSYKYGEEEGQEGSTIGNADNGVAAGSFFPTLWNNWGDAYVQADNTKVNLAAGATLSYSLDWKWGSTTTMTDIPSGCKVALIGIDPNTGSDDTRDGVRPKWYDYPFGTEWTGTGRTCNVGSADNWTTGAWSTSFSQGNLVGGSSYKIWVKMGGLPWTQQSAAGFTLTALNTPSDPTKGSDFALADTTGVQVVTSGESVNFEVSTADLDRYALVTYSGQVYIPGGNFGPLVSSAWTGSSPSIFMSDPGLKSATSITITGVKPGVYEVWGRGEGQDWVALTGVTARVEWKAPASSNAPVASSGGLEIVCSGTCTASSTVSSQNPSPTSYTTEWIPFGQNQVQYTTSSFDGYRIELKFTATLSTSEAYEIYFTQVDTASDANFYTTVSATGSSPSETELDTVVDAPGSEIGKNRSPCDGVGRLSSTSVAFGYGQPTRTNQVKTADDSNADAWDSRFFSVDSNYYNTFGTDGWSTFDSSKFSKAGSSAKFGYFQYGADNCQWGNGLRDYWIFPAYGTYQACYRSASGGFSGKRIYMDGSAPAADEADLRTYITISLTQPSVDNPASTTSIMFAVIVCIVAMLF